MIDFGRFVLLLAAILCSCAILTDLLAMWRENAVLAVIARYVTIGVFLCLTSAVITLWILLLNDNFSVDYVASHSSRGLPVLYKLSALWTGGAGALLLWLWFQIGFVCMVFFKNRSECLAFSSRGRSIANFVSAFFLHALIHGKHPFATSEVVPVDGGAGSESLGHMAMVLHVPILIIGYASLIVPFAWAFGYFKSDPDTHVNTMLSGARSWSLLAWCFLSAGILLGGWGGYKEYGCEVGQMRDLFFNLPLIPWVFAMVMVLCYRFYRSRSPIGTWAAMMSVLTFSLCVYGVFLARHVVDSSQTDSTDGGQGKFFVILLIHVWAIAAVMLLRRHFRKNKKLEKIYYKEERLSQ